MRRFTSSSCRWTTGVDARFTTPRGGGKADLPLRFRRLCNIFLGNCGLFPLEQGRFQSKALKPKSTMAKKAARKPNAAFMKPVTPDAALSAVVGSKPLPRTELTKKLWEYIKKNGLQDKKDRKQINADAALKVVFGGKAKVSMFEMTKLVSKHVA